MYSLGSDSLPGTSGVEGTVLIPTRFVWPYGGQEVFLIGSFTGWIEHVRMSPMEGLPAVFQTVRSLTPGLHQYKFLVDGEWRHDERQPFGEGSYGIVNYIELNWGPDITPPVLPPETHGNRSNMDVDCDTFFSVEAVPGPSEDVLHVSRRLIYAYLSSHTAYELLPESGKVIAFDVNLPIKQAFHILYEQGTPVAPLWDSSKGQFVGVLSPLDFILILKELGDHGSNLTEEQLETHTIYAWKEWKLNWNRQFDQNAGELPRGLIHAGSSSSLLDISLKILQHEVATVPVIHSPSQLLHLTSLSEILKCICRHFRHSLSSLPILQQPISSLPIGTWVPKDGESNRRPFPMLRPNAPLSSALSLLVEAQVSSIPIVDDVGSLLDIYSRSDITALAKDKTYTQIQLSEMTIHQALQLGQDANSHQCQMCLRSDSLLRVMEKLANPGVRRLIIVEAGNNRVEGIVSLKDVFRFLLNLETP